MANKSIEIIQAISNAVHNKHHGAMGGKQDWRRSEDPKELVMLDGFNVKFAGDKEEQERRDAKTIRNQEERRVEEAQEKRFALAAAQEKAAREKKIAEVQAAKQREEKVSVD